MLSFEAVLKINNCSFHTWSLWERNYKSLMILTYFQRTFHIHAVGREDMESALSLSFLNQEKEVTLYWHSFTRLLFPCTLYQDSYFLLCPCTDSLLWNYHRPTPSMILSSNLPLLVGSFFPTFHCASLPLCFLTYIFPSHGLLFTTSFLKD